MSRSNAKNFATATLATGGNNPSSPRNMTAGDLQFCASTGQGGAFPTVSSSLVIPYQPNNFVVAIDNELILCSGRSGDVFTVWSDGSGNTGRGYDNTTAASHIYNSALIVQAMPVNDLNHLWGVTGDAYNPDVPGWARGGRVNGLWSWTDGGTAPNANDDEFESQSPWTVYPLTSNLAGGSDNGATIDFNTSRRSMLHFSRSSAHTNATTYYVYKAFTPPSPPYVVLCKMSHAGKFWPHVAATYSMEAMFGLSDHSNPTGGVVGNAIRIGHHIGTDAWALGAWPGVSGSNQIWMPFNKSDYFSSSVATANRWDMSHGEVYFGIRNVGGGAPWQQLIGDGLTWRVFQDNGPGAFTPQSLVFAFSASSTWASYATQQEVVVDFVRVESW